MTMPSERFTAIENTRDFLRSLLDPKQTPRIPKAIRTKAYWCLRHYPWTLDMEEAAKKAPRVFKRNNR